MHSNATHRGRANILKRPNRLNVRSGSVAGPPPRRHCEDERDCVRSAIEIRKFLTDELTRAKSGRSLADVLRAMRVATRAFVDAAGPDARNFRYRGGAQTDEFSLALGELRSRVGLHVALISGQYGIEVEPGLL
jgi:hypothetical protein